MAAPSEDSIKIRRATVDDLAVLQDLGTKLMQSDRRFDPLFNETWYESEEAKKYFLKRIRGGKLVCFVAEVNGVVAGYLTGSVEKTETWRPIKRTQLGNLYVLPDYRRHGIGHMLVAEFRKWSKRKGAQRIMLYVTAGNEEGLAFYESGGFIPVQHIVETDC